MKRAKLHATLAAIFLSCSASLFGQSSAVPEIENVTEFIPRWNYSAEPSQISTIPERGTLRLPVARIWPTESVTLAASANEASLSGKIKEIAPQGATFVIVEGPVFAACEMARRPGWSNIYCLVDQDRDKYFDYYLKTYSPTEWIFNPVEIVSKKLLILPKKVPYVRKEGWAEDEKLMFKSYAFTDDDLIDGKLIRLGFCISRKLPKDFLGRDRQTSECLTSGVIVDVDYLPIERRILGTIVSVRGSREAGFVYESRPVVSSGTTTFGMGKCDPDVFFRPIKNCG